MEDQGPGGEGCRHPSFQDTNSQQRDIGGRRELEGWVPSQNASVRVRRTVLCLHTDRQVKTSIPTPEKVLKWLTSTLPDASARKTTTDHVPHMPLRCPHGATLLPCATARCYCGATMPHSAPTTLKVASAVNVPPPHAQSSHFGEGMALASLDQDEVLEDDFQTQHTPVHHVKW